MEVSIRMWINRRPRLSHTVYDSLRSFVDFKADMHNMYIKAHKDLVQNWPKLPFIVIDDAIFAMVDSWPPEWCAPDLAVHNKTTIQK